MVPPPSGETPRDREPIETIVVDGLAMAKEIRAELAAEVQELVDAGRRSPCLAVVLVGDDPASRSYIKGKQRACKAVGIDSIEHVLPEATTQRELLALVQELNDDAEVDGILVQLPLPSGLDARSVAYATDPGKDVDAFHPDTAGRLLIGDADLVACTPLGIMEVLRRCEVPIEGAHAVVIGRSNLVGKPVSLLLQQANATVTMCHSRTRNLPELCRQADILVAATGVPRMVKGDWIKPGAAVMDVGVSEVDGALIGDVDFEAAQGIARFITPSRRGIGPMTITMLLRNTLHAYRARTGA